VPVFERMIHVANTGVSPGETNREELLK
jgi:hypothetical protein